MRVEVVDGGRQPPRRSAGIIIHECQNFALSHGSGSISSSCGITILLDDVSYAVVPSGPEWFGRDDNQLERERCFLVQDRPSGALSVTADPFDRHDHSDFHGSRVTAHGSQLTAHQGARRCPL